MTPATVPGIPTTPTAQATDQSAVVSWVAPTSTGGAPISNYSVTSTPGGFTCSSTTSPCTVSGLTAGTGYTFKVTATNSAGTGVASVATSSVTPTVTPTLVEQVSTSGTTAGGGNKTLSTSTFSSPTTSGDWMILQTGGDYTGSSKVSAVSGGGVTTWTSATQKNGTSGNGDIEIWYGKVTSATTAAVQVTTGTTATNVTLLNASEWSNLAATPLDLAASGNGSGTTFTAGPITTTANGDLIVSDAWSSVTGYTSAQNSTTAGFNILSQSIFSSSYRGWDAYQIAGVAGSASAGWTQYNSTSGNYATAVAAFKP
jgi:hypothetical protein